MKSFDAATAAYLGGRSGMIAHRLVLIQARNLTTDLVETLGLWSGEQDAGFTIAGAAFTFTGAGPLLDSEPITSAAGLDVRMWQLGLSAVAPEVENLVKGYETRFAPIRVYRAFFDTDTQALVSEPHRVFRGRINSIDFLDAAPGELPSCIVECTSSTRDLTRKLALMKSDASQRRRGGDRFRRYGDISGVVPVYWGEKRADAPGTTESRTGGQAGV